jgi:hypothetical protein
VPTHGYFARYLELLHNPTEDPITIDVEVASDLDSEAATRIVDETPGEWIVTDDDSGNDPWPSSDQTLVHVFGRAGRLSPPAVTAPTTATDTLAYRWNSITIPARETVALMHFAVQQPTQTAAQASAVRLAQLPPEALVDLSASEIAAISNFEVPADGVGSVPPLVVAQAFTVSGEIFMSNGTTPANPRNEVTLRSSNPIYSREVKASVAASSYAVTNTIADGWSLEASNLPPRTV